MKKYILTITLGLIAHWGFSQGIPGSHVSPFFIKENTSKSPEVAAMGTYGQFQANPYNGNGNFSIPLHTVDFDGIQIPITLSYNSAGVRVAQDAGWVGLNWNLSTTFGISRTIYGADDFDDSTAPNVQPSESSIEVPKNGYIHNFYEVPSTTNGSLPNAPVSYLHRVFNSFLNEGPTMPSQEVDTQPDIFEANVFGKTYKFQLVKTGGSNSMPVKVFNNNNVIITLDLTEKSFTLLDDKGFTYYFSSKERSTTFVPIDGGSGFGTLNGPGTYPEFLSHLNGDRDKKNEEVITHWHLDSVTSPLGEILNFTYTDGLSLTFPAPRQSRRFSTGIVNDYRTIGIGQEPIGTTTVIKHKYLTEISGDFGSVDFELGNREDLCTLNAIYKFAGYNSLGDDLYSLSTNGMEVKPSDFDRSKKLDRILIKDFNGLLKKTITFNTSYFNSHKVNDPVKERYLRLKLDGVTINDRNYSFTYINSNSLPPKDSRSIDFWGFYNGVANTDLIPTIGRFMTSKFSGHEVTGQYFLKLNGGIRKSDFTYGKIALLNKVTYPTRGYAEFIYEPHDIVLPTTPTFHVQEHINLNGVDRIKWTDMTDENRFNFTYQYLKYATHPNYDYYALALPELGNPIEAQIISGQEFTIDFLSEVTAVGLLSLPYGGNLPQSYDVYYIENMDTGDRQSLIKYDEGPTSSGYNVEIYRSVFLNPGTYRIQNNYTTGPPMLFSGDFTLFTYENTNLDESDFYERFEVGGARVAKITNRDANGEFISSVGYDYEYLDGAEGLKSSGKLMDELIFFSSANGYHSYNPHAYNQQGVTFTSYNTAGSTLSAQGSHIGYTFVQERQLDVYGHALGRTDKVFKNSANVYFKESWNDKPYSVGLGGQNFGHDDVKISNTIVLGLPPKNNPESSNGLLKMETLYNSADEIVQQTVNEYQQLSGEQDESFFTKFMPIWEVDLNSFLTYNQYFFYRTPQNFFDKFVLSNSETYTYFPAENLKTENNYTYNSDTHYIESSETILNELEIKKDVFFYPQDPEVEALEAMDLLRSENRLSNIIREESYHNSNLLGVKEYGYGYASGVTAGNTMITSIKTAKGSNILETQMEIERYDAKGNVLQFRKSDGRPVTYLRGYNSMYIVAKIENGTYNQAIGTGVSQDILNNPTSEQQMLDELQHLRDNLPNAMVTTHSYDPLVGVTSETDPRGYTIHYHYDEYNRLKEVRDQNNNLINDYKYHYKPQH